MAEPLDDLERRTLEAFDELSHEDRQRMLLVVAAMRAGIEIDRKRTATPPCGQRTGLISPLAATDAAARL